MSRGTSWHHSASSFTDNVGTYLTQNCRSKAVAEGTVLYHTDRVVASRITPTSYGVDCHIPYDSTSPKHIARPELRYWCPYEGDMIGSIFDCILEKVGCQLPHPYSRGAYFAKEYQRIGVRHLWIVVHSNNQISYPRESTSIWFAVRVRQQWTVTVLVRWK